MKKYKLLKDLPDHPKGSEFTIEEHKMILGYWPNKHPDFFEPVNEWPKSWKELNIKSGFNVLSDGGLFFTDKPIHTEALYPTEEHAKSALAFAQLSQLVKAMNGDWVADWENENQAKFVVGRMSNVLYIDCWRETFYLISFHSREAAEFSLEHHRSLWEQYYMM